MRHLPRQMLTFLCMIVVGLGLGAAAGRETDRYGVLMVLLMSGGWTLAAIGAILLVMRLPLLVGRARLVSGRTLLARWHVTPAEWEAFRTVDARRAALGKDYANDFDPPPEIPPGGLDILFGRGSVLIGDSYHVLRTWGMPALIGVDYLPGAPACLEFTIRYASGRVTPATTMRLRVPIAADAGPAGGRVFEHYRDRVPRKRG